MPILYCSLICKNDKILLAESKKSESFNKRIKSLFKKMLVGNVGDVIEIEDEKIVTYLRTKHTIFICVSSNKTSSDRPKRFLKRFLEIIIAEFKSLENIIPKNTSVTKFILQERLENKLNSLIEEFDTEIVKSTETIINITKDMNDIKVNMNTNVKKIVENDNDLNELLVSSKKLNVNSTEFKNASKNLEKETRCIKPCVLYLLMVTIIMIIVYLIFGFYFCGSATIFCERK